MPITIPTTCAAPSRRCSAGHSFFAPAMKPRRRKAANVNETAEKQETRREQTDYACLREAGAGGSNPLTPTIIFNGLAIQINFRIYAETVEFHSLSSNRCIFGLRFPPETSPNEPRSNPRFGRRKRPGDGRSVARRAYSTPISALTYCTFSTLRGQTCTPNNTRPVESAKAGKIIALPQVGGLDHRCERLAA